MGNEVVLPDLFSVQVCFVSPSTSFLCDLNVPLGTTIEQAIEMSGVVEQCPDSHFPTLKVGIFSRIKSRDTMLKEGDRIEIYRPLTLHPMVARRQRVENSKKERRAT